MSRQIVTFQSAGEELIGIIEYPSETPAPAVLLFHGLTNHKTDCPLINETAQALVQNGFISFRFDFFGSGESPGELREKTIDILEQNAKDSIEFILSDGRVNELGLWGRSVGGTIACLMPPHPEIKASVTASGAALFEQEFKKKFPSLQKREAELEKRGQKLPGTGEYKGEFKFGETWYKSLEGLDERVTQNLKKLDSILVLATTPDQKISLKNACHIINNVNEPKKIWIFEEVDHDYVGVEDRAVNITIDWFKKHLN